MKGDDVFYGADGRFVGRVAVGARRCFMEPTGRFMGSSEVLYGGDEVFYGADGRFIRGSEVFYVGDEECYGADGALYA